MKYFIYIILFTILFSFKANAQIRHGLILGGGDGICNNAKIKSDEVGLPLSDLKGKIDYKYNLVLGYKIRIQQNESSHFFDIDLSTTAKKINYRLDYYKDGIYQITQKEGNNIYYNLSANLNYNHYVLKKFYIGMGLEPTLYLANMDGFLDKMVFDIPVTAKIGYDFKKVDIAFTYKYGFTNALQSDNFKSGKLRDWQIQVFIPFSSK